MTIFLYLSNCKFVFRKNSHIFARLKSISYIYTGIHIKILLSEIEICVLYEKMKFGETFTEYLRGEEEWFLEKCRHVEYKKLKKVLKKCKTTCNTTRSDDEHINSSATLSDSCQCQSCPCMYSFSPLFPLFFTHLPL